LLVVTLAVNRVWILRLGVRLLWDNETSEALFAVFKG
jgi:hypothetical protein